MYIKKTEEKEYLIAHNTSDTSGLITGNLFVTDTIGNEKLLSQYGNGGNAEVYSVHKVTDDSYIMAGNSSMKEGEPSDFWLIKIDENGDELWKQTYGGVVPGYFLGQGLDLIKPAIGFVYYHYIDYKRLQSNLKGCNCLAVIKSIS